jgi:hypothetical protein
MDELYEIINGKRYKKCKEGQIRNPLTKRCINKDNRTALNLLKLMKERPNYLYKYVKKRERRINKEEELSISPIDIYEKRLKIYKKIIKTKEENIKIGGNIIFKNKLNYGINIYSSYLTSNPKILIATELVINNKKSDEEKSYLNKVSNLVINKNCPHFPLLYRSQNIQLNDDELIYLPKLLKVEKNKSYKIIMTEHIDGNLKNLFHNIEGNDEIFMNAISQIFISMMFFYHHTSSFHNNSSWDNLIYKKTESGGYYQYEISGTKFYIENKGYLWMLWDYDNCIEFSNSLKKKIMIKLDFEKIILNFLPIKFNGIIKKMDYKLSNDSMNKIKKLYDRIKYYDELYSSTGLSIFISKILQLLILNGFLLTSVKSNDIINKNPFKI